MLELKESGINCISKEYLESIPKLEGTKYFQLLTGIPNNDPDLREREKKPFLFGHVQILTNDTIRDPFSKKPVRIGVVEDFDVRSGEVTKYRSFVPNQHLMQNPGIFSLHEGNLDDEELYEYLQICNRNRDNPHRDKKVEAMFYEIKSVTPTAVKPQPIVVEVKKRVKEPEVAATV